MSGVYWSLTALHLLGAEDQLDKKGILEFIKKCQHKCGGFGASEGHDPHLLYTLSAVQVRANEVLINHLQPSIGTVLSCLCYSIRFKLLIALLIGSAFIDLKPINDYRL